MTGEKKLKLIIISFLAVFISGVVADSSADLGICSLYSSCGSALIFAYGRPIINLFSILILFITPLILFNERFLKFWANRIFIFSFLPILFTFSRPMYCGGFLGCIVEREWMASASAIAFVIIMALCMAGQSFIWWKREKRLKNVG